MLYNSGNYSVMDYNEKGIQKECVIVCVCVCVYKRNHFDIYQKLTHIVDQV